MLGKSWTLLPVLQAKIMRVVVRVVLIVPKLMHFSGPEDRSMTKAENKDPFKFKICANRSACMGGSRSAPWDRITLDIIVPSRLPVIVFHLCLKLQLSRPLTARAMDHSGHGDHAHAGEHDHGTVGPQSISSLQSSHGMGGASMQMQVLGPPVCVRQVHY